MSLFTGKTPAATYGDILCVGTGSSVGLTNVLTMVTDAYNNPTPLSLSTIAFNITRSGYTFSLDGIAITAAAIDINSMCNPNPVALGTQSLTVPIGTTADRGIGPYVNGMMRYNSQTNSFEGYEGGSWVDFATSGSGVSSVSGTLNRILITGTTSDPIVDISPNYVGQASITTVGTVITGTWNAGIIPPAYGGTGVNNGVNELILTGDLATTGGYSATFNFIGPTNVTFPTSGTLATTGSTVSSITGTANQIVASASVGAITLSIANNAILPGAGGVTLPIGNTATRAGAAGTIRFNSQTTAFEGTVDGSTWSAFSQLTVPISLTNGGTNAALTANNGGIFYSTATAGAILAGTPTAGQMLQSGATAAPSWSSSIWPSSVGSAGVLLRSDGASNVYSVFTIADTYTLGDLLYASAANTLTALAGNITTSKQYLSQTGTGSVSASPVWSSIAGTDITGAALTKTDDTNVTLTLGGTPASALLRATSLTLGWTGELAVARGGTGLSSTTINQLLYSSANNVIAGLSTANSAVLTTSASGVPVMSSTMTDGQVIIGSTGSTPVAASLTAGANISITPGPGTITIAATSSSSGTLKSFQVLTSGTSATYTTPAGVNNLLIECIGGGGGGGNAAAGSGSISIGGGGGGGAYVRHYIVGAAASYTYTIGTGGAAASNGNATTFSGGTLSAGGGVAGQSTGGSTTSNIARGGNGGTASGGNIMNQSGQCGNTGNAFFGTGGAVPGNGGSSILGSGAPSPTGNPASGIAALANSGGGGSGASVYNTASSQNGGAGGSGLIIVWEFS